MAAPAFSIESIGSTIGFGSADLKESTLNVIRFSLGFLVLLSVALLIIGGIDWMISGDSDVVKTRARRIMIYSIIALAISLLAWAIVTFVIRTTVNVTN